MSFGKVQNYTITHKTLDYRTSLIFSDSLQGHCLSFLCCMCS